MQDTNELSALQSELRAMDLNGYLTLEADEQCDAAILRDAIAYLKANS